MRRHALEMGSAEDHRHGLGVDCTSPDPSRSSSRGGPRRWFAAVAGQVEPKPAADPSQGAALDEEARRIGPDNPRRDHAHDLTAIPISKGVTGAFDPGRFQATIRHSASPNSAIIADQRRVSLRRQIAGTISAGLEPPKSLIEPSAASNRTARGNRIRQTGRGTRRNHRSPSPETLVAYFERITRPSSRARISARYLLS